MDDIYEFENGEYRLATVKIKAIAYDVVTEITRKKQELKKSSMEEEKKQNLLTSLVNISDKIVELTDMLEQQLQQLDDTIERVEHFQSSSEPVQEKEQETPPVPEKKVEQEVVEKAPINPQPVVTVEKETVVGPPTKEVEEEKIETPIVEPVVKPPIAPTEESTIIPVSKSVSKEESAPPRANIEPSAEPVIQEIVTEPEPNDEEKVGVTEPQDAKEEQKPVVTSSISSPVDNSKELTVKRFQKTTKNLSKAIMVRPNQLENLRNSRLYQEQLLTKKGLLLASTEITEPIPEPKQGPKTLPDDVERQIEDLTVKANIYYNEGEVDKAQELYDQIKALNKEYQ